MALFYKLSIDVINAILQMDKTADKKFFANCQAQGKINTDAAVATPQGVFLQSFQINSRDVELKSVSVHREINLISQNAGLTTFNILSPELLNLPIPYFRNQVMVGLSDQPTNGTVTDLQTYAAQQKIVVPCMLDSNFKEITLHDINEKFTIANNISYLNVFIYFNVLENYDVTDFYTMLAAKFNYAPLTLPTYLFDYSIFVSGRCH